MEASSQAALAVWEGRLPFAETLMGTEAASMELHDLEAWPPSLSRKREPRVAPSSYPLVCLQPVSWLPEELSYATELPLCGELSKLQVPV